MEQVIVRAMNYGALSYISHVCLWFEVYNHQPTNEVRNDSQGNGCPILKEYLYDSHGKTIIILVNKNSKPMS